MNNNISGQNNKLNYTFYFVAFSGAFAVLFSAWLSHAGRELPIEDFQRLVIAVAMQFIHTLALLTSLVWLKITSKTKPASKALIVAIYCFMLGILLFSGLLYLKTFIPISFLGKLTPFGGISLTLGWIMLAIAAKE